MAEDKASHVCAVLTSDEPLLAELAKCNLSVMHVDSEDKLLEIASKSSTEMVVFDATDCKKDKIGAKVAALIKANKQAFVCVYGKEIGQNPHVRIQVANNGGPMTTWSSEAVREAADRVYGTLFPSASDPVFGCPYCKKPRLSEDAMWAHCPMYHLNEKNIEAECPICKKVPQQYLQVHLRNFHGPVRRGELPNEFHPDISLYSFGLVVCQREDGKFLLVQEKANEGFWMPGGRLNPGEGLITGAMREVEEEAGIDVELTGVLKLEFLPSHSRSKSFVRLRCVFMAKPANPNDEPKSIPDFESIGATWVSLEEMDGLRLRSSEPRHWAEYLAKGGTVFPLSVLETT